MATSGGSQCERLHALSHRAIRPRCASEGAPPWPQYRNKRPHLVRSGIFSYGPGTDSLNAIYVPLHKSFGYQVEPPRNVRARFVFLRIETVGLTRAARPSWSFRPSLSWPTLGKTYDEGRNEMRGQRCRPATSGIRYRYAHPRLRFYTETLPHLTTTGLNMLSQAKSPGVTIGRN